ncbi:hypothetical protein Moror_4088 [Moniliophthora roreri MCA 2997]|uniref:Uncharacterized protein n=1 Tax=Moniliophthora roreri (strain MCA 2997) TaxID=1381753 RepID=V2XE18_MONRO|nr:hypothetical protein Moror_4088 [Moniliophthora roreri MCA 2997]
MAEPLYTQCDSGVIKDTIELDFFTVIYASLLPIPRHAIIRSRLHETFNFNPGLGYFSSELDEVGINPVISARASNLRFVSALIRRPLETVFLVKPFLNAEALME